MQPDKIIQKLITHYKSVREFARFIDEDSADVYLWKTGRRAIHPRACISIVKHHPEYTPHELNPNVFEKGLTLVFNNNKGKK